MQNFAPAGFSAPQLGQPLGSVLPQDMQKRALSGFCVPHAEHSDPHVPEVTYLAPRVKVRWVTLGGLDRLAL